MIQDTFLKLIRQSLPFEPTEVQKEVIGRLFAFIFSEEPMSAYILRGYAGTGKTTLMAAIVKVLLRLEREVVLLAPTGRAAKVLALHAGYPAYTIHKEIYRQRQVADINAAFDLDINKHKNAIFIIDEASMIANDNSGTSMFAGGQLLDDLISYVYSGPGCKIIFVGDNAQLPPVGEEESPALTPSRLKMMGLNATGFQLATVMRQDSDSGILANATRLRQHLARQLTDELPKIQFTGYPDVSIMPGAEIVDSLDADYGRYGLEDVVIITRSNKRAVEYNLGIRNMIFGRDEILTRGDAIMVVRNNYYWTEMLAAEMKRTGDTSPLPVDFLANGDIGIVQNIRRHYEFYDLHFADITVTFPDYDDFEMDVRVILDSLTTESPSLTKEQSDRLYYGVMEDYAEIKTKKERTKKLRLDPNYNALQIKYAYAVTCHKAQGGQWHNVYIDQGWLPPDGVDKAYYRWLYTALTRSTHKAYFVNWPENQTE